MPVDLSQIDRRQAMKGMLVFGGSVLWPNKRLLSALSGSVALDPNQIALLADTHISENPEQFVYGTRWPGAPYQDTDIPINGSAASGIRSMWLTSPRLAIILERGTPMAG